MQERVAQTRLEKIQVQRVGERVPAPGGDTVRGRGGKKQRSTGGGGGASCGICRGGARIQAKGDLGLLKVRSSLEGIRGVWEAVDPPDGGGALGHRGVRGKFTSWCEGRGGADRGYAGILGASAGSQ